MPVVKIKDATANALKIAPIGLCTMKVATEYVITVIIVSSGYINTARIIGVSDKSNFRKV